LGFGASGNSFVCDKLPSKPHKSTRENLRRSNPRLSFNVTKERIVPAGENFGEKFSPGVSDELAWAALISDHEWEICLSAIRVLREAGVEFLVGGAFGLAAYTGRLRNTKDIDFFILPTDVPRAIAALSEAGFHDFYARHSYDRRWIYRSTRHDFIVDLIFRMANRRADIDRVWFERATQISIRGESLSVIPAEELLWQKLYVMQRDRCDWPDVLNLIYAVGRELNWDRLLARLGEDVPLLRAALNIFDWLCPECAAQLPQKLRDRLQLPEPAIDAAPGVQARRVSSLDSRSWFAASRPKDEPLEI